MSNNTLQIAFEKTTAEILAKSGCANLPAVTQESFEEQIQMLLLQRWINTALANLSEEEAAEFIEKAESISDETEVFGYLGEIFSKNNDAESILLEEAKYLEEELVNS
jgi:hypothetical protein